MFEMLGISGRGVGALMLYLRDAGDAARKQEKWHSTDGYANHSRMKVGSVSGLGLGLRSCGGSGSNTFGEQSSVHVLGLELWCGFVTDLGQVRVIIRCELTLTNFKN